MRTKITLTAVALIAAVVASGCGGTSQADTTAQKKPATERSGDPVSATLSEWKVATSSQQASAGKVTFDAKNTGKAPHEFVVIKTDKPAGKLGTGARVPESGNVGETGDIAPGASKSVSLKLKPGHYALICNLPGHYKLGMHTDLTVR